MTSSIECTGATAPQLSLPVQGVQGSTRRERPATVGASSGGSTRMMSQRCGQPELGPPAASHLWAPEKKSFSQDNNNNLINSGASSRPPSSSSSPSSETILRPGTALPQTSMERSNVLTQSLVQAHLRDELPNQSAKVRMVYHIRDRLEVGSFDAKSRQGQKARRSHEWRVKYRYFSLFAFLYSIIIDAFLHFTSLCTTDSKRRSRHSHRGQDLQPHGQAPLATTAGLPCTSSF